MKQTFYQPFDFLDIDPDRPAEELLWKAGIPSGAEIDGRDAILAVPFHKQLPGLDITPDKDSSPKEYQLRLRAYGDSILRIGTGFGSDIFRDSEMLEMHPDLEVNPLSIENSKDEWLIRDRSGTTRARLNLRKADTDHWSDLLPPPEPSLELEFYPDGKKSIALSAFDQFFPSRQEAFPLAFVEKEGRCHRAALSFRAEPGEVFAGTGERFAKADLSGRCIELRNLDGQGVNSLRTYKNIPFFISSRMTGIFMHTSSYGKISLAGHSTRSVQLMAEEDMLDIFLIGGDSPEEILFLYRQLTGFPSMPPLWSFGTWMSRMTYFSADEVEEICDRLRSEDYPADVIHLDTGWFRTDCSVSGPSTRKGSRIRPVL
jgi:alpha-D-xyloside xylohydrolase